jgi:hypothetical protein
VCRARAHEGDYSQLETALEALPSCPVEYRPPDAKAMAEALAEKLGVEKKVFQVRARNARRAHDLLTTQRTTPRVDD